MKITFYFPYHHVSGVPVLFLNLAEYLGRNHPELEVVIIDYPDGHMASGIDRQGHVKLEEFRNGQPCRVSGGFLIMQAVLPYAMRPELVIDPGVRILFWNLYPDIFFPVVFPFVFFRETALNHLDAYRAFLKTLWGRQFRRLEKFIREAIEGNSLRFMDRSTFRRTEEILGKTLPEHVFLPIACDGGPARKKEGKRDGTAELNVAWVGRLCDFKYHSVELLMRLLSSFSTRTGRRVILHVVGTGDYLEYLQKAVPASGTFQVRFPGTVPKNELDRFLTGNVDINVSMGTSALESARLSIPTILVDYSYSRIPDDYRFRWIFETEEYDMGHLVSGKDVDPAGPTLEALIRRYDEDPALPGELSYEYFSRNHSVGQVAKALLDILDGGVREFGTYDPRYFRKGYLRRLYEYRKYH